MPDEFCPDCGTPRTALFRFCRGCNLDFDDLDARGELPGGPFSLTPGSPRPRPFDGVEVVADGLIAPQPFGRRPSAMLRPGAVGAFESFAPLAPTRPAGEAVTDIVATDTLTPIRRARTPQSARRSRLQRYTAIALTAVVVVGVVAALGMNAAWDLHLQPSTDGGGSGATAGVAGVTGGPVATAAATDPVSNEAPTPGSAGPTTPTGPTVDGIVERVIDGDTILVNVGREEWRVRYIGMDTPESVKPDSPVQYMGPEAARANQRLVGGQTVTLEQEVSDFDQYGRRLRDVWVHLDGGTLALVGYELVRQGYARIDTVPPDVKYQAAMLSAQQEARAADRGLWGSSSGASPSPGATLSPIDLPALVSVKPVIVRAGIPTVFQGARGDYSWRTVSFEQPTAKVTWTVTSALSAGCQLDWRIVADAGRPVTGTVLVDGKGTVSDQASADTTTSPTIVQITTDCSKWKFSLTGRSAL